MMIVMGTLVFMLAVYHPELEPETLNVFLADTEGNWLFYISLSIILNESILISMSCGLNEGLNVLFLVMFVNTENLFAILRGMKCRKL